MNIAIALKLLYYIFLLLPVLTMIAYLGQGLYHLRQDYGDYIKEFIIFLKGIPVILLYGLSIMFINNAIKTSIFPIVGRIAAPIILVLLSTLYGYIIVDDKSNFLHKITASGVFPCFLLMISWIEKILI